MLIKESTNHELRMLWAASDMRVCMVRQTSVIVFVVVSDGHPFGVLLEPACAVGQCPRAARRYTHFHPLAQPAFAGIIRNPPIRNPKWRLRQRERRENGSEWLTACCVRINDAVISVHKGGSAQPLQPNTRLPGSRLPAVGFVWRCRVPGVMATPVHWRPRPRLRTAADTCVRPGLPGIYGMPRRRIRQGGLRGRRVWPPPRADPKKSPLISLPARERFRHRGIG